MYLGSRLTPPIKALSLNSRARVISETWFDVTGAEPVNDLDSYPLRDGIHAVPSAGSEAPNGIRVYPISEGSPGGLYWMRVWGWDAFGNDPNTQIWKPCLLAELLCVAGGQRGLANRIVTDKEWFAGGIQVTRGQAYVTAGATAYATIGLVGVQKIQFDIAPGDGAPAFGNAWFAYI